MDDKPGRVWCSTSYQGALEGDGTVDVITGPDCPVHHFPMYRAPHVPDRHVWWICHGYDGEGCREIVSEAT